MMKISIYYVTTYTLPFYPFYLCIYIFYSFLYKTTLELAQSALLFIKQHPKFLPPSFPIAGKYSRSDVNRDPLPILQKKKKNKYNISIVM